MTKARATTLAAAITAETALRTAVVDVGDDEYVVDIEVAPTSSGVRHVLTAWDAEDWPWLRKRL